MLEKIYKTDEITIYEQSPTSRTISVDGKLHYLKFPYLVFILRKEINNSEINNSEINNLQFHVFASNKSIKGNEDPIVCHLPLPNIFYMPNEYMDVWARKHYGDTCLGLGNLSSDLTKNIDRFWLSQFNSNAIMPHIWNYGNPIKLKDLISLKYLFQLWGYNYDI